jgi:hypothetical protein
LPPQSQAASAERIPFEDGPPHRVQTWLGLIRAGSPRVVSRAILVAAVAWLPLAVLTAVRGDFIRPDRANAFLPDFAVHARFLIAAPLLVLAESLCAPRLTAIARQFLASGLIVDGEHARYDEAVTSSRRLLESPLAEGAAFVLAYGLIAVMVLGRLPLYVPAWHGELTGNSFHATPAGWWGLLVSLPLLFVLLLGWLWRLGIWTRFLWLMSRLELQLIPSHPDRAAGLQFVGSSLRAFGPLGLTAGVIVAGTVANRIVHLGSRPGDLLNQILGALIVVLVLFAAPLLVFVQRLNHEHHRGMFRYGALAVRVGDQLEHRWLRRPIDPKALEAPDFSATTDLYSITANVYALRVVPLDFRDLAILLVITLLPFVPVALLAIPLGVLIEKVADLFL